GTATVTAVAAGSTVATTGSGATVISAPLGNVTLDNSGTGTATVTAVAIGSTVATTGTGSTIISAPIGDVTLQNSGTGTATVTGAAVGSTVATTGSGATIISAPLGNVTLDNSGTGTATVTAVAAGSTVATTGSGATVIRAPLGNVVLDNSGTGIATVTGAAVGSTVATNGSGATVISAPLGNVTLNNTGTGTVTVSGATAGSTIAAGGTGPVLVNSALTSPAVLVVDASGNQSHVELANNGSGALNVIGLLDGATLVNSGSGTGATNVVNPVGNVSLINDGSSPFVVTGFDSGKTLSISGTGPTNIVSPDGNLTVANTGGGLATVTGAAAGSTIQMTGSGPTSISNPAGNVSVNNSGTGTTSVVGAAAGSIVHTAGSGPTSIANPAGNVTVDNGGTGTTTVTGAAIGSIVHTTGSGSTSITNPAGNVTIDNGGTGITTVSGAAANSTVHATGTGAINIANPAGNVTVDSSSSGIVTLSGAAAGSIVHATGTSATLITNPLGNITVDNTGSGITTVTGAANGSTIHATGTGVVAIDTALAAGEKIIIDPAGNPNLQVNNSGAGLVEFQGDLALSGSHPLSLTLNGNGTTLISEVGALSLTNTPLSLTLSSGYVPTPGDYITLINNDGVDAITGTFAGLPEGADVLVGGKTFTISYVGGSGNDVVLHLNIPAVIGGASTAALTETDAILTTTGTLTSSDADGTANLFVAQSNVAGSNGYGHFSIGTNGVWSYATDTAHNEFANGTTYTDTFTVKAADGTRQVITVSIAGSAEHFVGTSGNDIYIVTDAADTVTEAPNGGTDEVRTGLASYTLSANVENLTFTGTADATGTGNGLANVITGNVGNDTLDGGAGADTLIGGSGNDTYLVDSPGDVVIENSNAGTDEVRSTAATYTLGANVENLTLLGSGNINGTGNALANILTGNSGNNTLDGGAGIDTMAGGLGNDIYVVDNAGDIVIEAVNAGTDEIRTSLASYSLVGTNVENLTFTGSGNVIGTGNAFDNTITGNNGNGTFSGGAGNDTFVGGSGTDTLDYSDETGRVVVTMTNTIGTSAGTSTGNDQFSGIENILGSAGDDIITGNDNYNLLTGGAGNDVLSGGIGNDTLIGGSGNDTLDGGSGNDILIGGTGNDTYIGGAGVDKADFSAETNAISINLASGSGTDGNGDTDTFTGVENITAGSGNDTLMGDAAANQLDGGSGNDRISGGAGNDVLIGGAGIDTLDYSASTNAVIVNMSAAAVGAVAANTASDGTGGTDTLSGFETILGGSGNDSLYGDSLDNTLIGNDGNDLLSGGAGIDTLQGGAGDDLLRGGAGNDSLDGGSNTAFGDTADYSDQGIAVTVSLATLTATGASIGTDTLANIENIRGGTANDILTGDAGANQISGNAGNDTLVGGAGNDLLRGGQGNDSIDGGADIDTVSYDDITGPVTINLAAGTATQSAGGNAGTDTLINIENVIGSGGSDTITGSSGDNVIDGANGGDIIAAGAGNDIVYFDENDASVNGEGGTDTLLVRAGTSTIDLTLIRDEVFTNFEILDITDAGTQFVKISDSDVKALTGGGSSGTLIINGGAEDSVRLVGANWPTTGIPTEDIGGVHYNVYAYNGATVKIADGVSVGYLFSSDDTGQLTNGSSGGDIYQGNGGNDTFYGRAGDDYGDAGSGDDYMEGGTGNDTLLGGTGNDTIYGGDALGSAGSGNDNIDAGDGDDIVYAGDGDDIVAGGAGNDRIDAGSGNDTVTGGDGNDTIDGGSGADNIDGGSGNDVINAGSGNDVVNAGIGDDIVVGGAGDDTIDGSSGVDTIDYSAETANLVVNLTTGIGSGAASGNDTLLNFENITGGAGNDTLTGNDGANRIIGGAGSDTISTGAGNDWILFDAADAHVDAGIGIDTLAIADTSPVDFTAIADDRFVGIEELDLTGNGIQNLTLNGTDVLAFSDSADTLKIHGDAGDHVTLSGNWVNGGVQPVSYNGGASESYVKWTLTLNGATATVLADPAITLDVVYLGATTNDTLTGGSGADVVDGGAGDDILDGGAGVDTLIGGTGNDTIYYDSADASADGGAGTDTLKFSNAASGVVLDFGDLARPATGGLRPTLTGFEIIDITGSGKNTVVIDSASLKALSDTTDSLDITGNAGDTVYIVGSWTDAGTAGGYHSYTKDGATIRIASAIAVSAVVDDPNGEADSAVPIPGATSGADVIRGLGGNDTLDGGAGADVLRGGAGDDVLIYDAADLVVDGGDDIDTLRLLASLNLSGHAGSQITNIETIDLVSGGSNITLTANAADITALNGTGAVTVLGDSGDAVALSGNWITGADINGFTTYTLDGASLTVASAIAVTVTYSGTSLGDIMTAGAGTQILDALSGNDTLDGGPGNDTLLGGSGDDVLIYDAADGTVSGGNGNDTLKVLGSGVTIDLTSIANNRITGIEKIDITGSGDNTVVANADDVQALSTDTDTLIVVGDVGDSVRLSGAGWEARGSELVAGITYNKFIGYATDGSMVTILGGLKMVKGDQIVGSSGNDNLIGGTGSDDIQGMAGDDTIAGGIGSDIIDGGSGNDTITYDAGDASIAGGADNDTLVLVTNGEIIDLQETPAVAVRPVLTGFETIDLNSTGANYLILDETTLHAQAGSTLTVNGTAEDIVFVDGALTSTLNLTGGVTQVALTRGTAGDDVITGTSGQDAIKTDGGNDTVNGGAGADIISTGAGDDIVTYDASDLRVFGGSGTDTLKITTADADGGISRTSAGTNTTAGDIDLTLVSGVSLKGFEVIDMRGNGDQTVKLDEASIKALSDTDSVTVLGDLGDVLRLYGGWVYNNVESDADGKIYTVMQKGDAYAHVVSEVTLDITNELGGKVIIGTSGADDRTVSTNGGMITGDGDDLIRFNSMSFTGVDGGRGYDKAVFQFAGDINTSLMSPTSLTNMEEIDLASGYAGANKLILTPEKLLELTDADHILVVKGTVGTDSIDLYGDWSAINTAPDVLYNGTTYKAVTAANGGQLYFTPGMTVAAVDPTPQMTAFSVSYDDGAYLVSAGIDKYAGWKVANAGDVNKDGIDDMIVNQMNSAYVVFGTQSMQGQIDMNNLGSRGFMISNTGVNDLTSYADWQSLNYGVSAIGDVNGDGIADMISSTGNFNSYTIIYGRTNWSNIDLNNFTTSASNGFTVATGFNWGGSVLSGTAAVGDVNGDGYGDYMIDQMWSADVNGQGDSGKGYLMFGGAYSGNINTGNMATTKGIVISSDSANYIKLGTDIAAIGDVNADGFADLAIGGPGVTVNRGPNGQEDRSGSGYVIFGKADGWANSIVVQRDNVAPTFRPGNTTPVDGQTGYPLAYNPEIQQAFSEGVAMGTGYISLYNQDTGALVEKFDVATGLGSNGGKVGLRSWGTTNDLLQINAFNPLSVNSRYYINIDPTAIKDLAGNYYAGISDTTSWNFSTTGSPLNDFTAPVLNTATVYGNNATAVIALAGGTTGVSFAAPTSSTTATDFRMDFTFNENVKPYGTVSVMQNGVVLETINLQTGVGSKGGSVYFPSGSVTQDYSYFGANFGTSLAGNSLTTVTFSGFQDVSGNLLNGGADQSISFTTAVDSAGPVLTNATRLHTPVDNQGNVSVENNIVFQSDETLRLGTSGSIELRLSSTYNGAAVERFSVGSAATGSNGVITLTGDHGGVLTVDNKTVTMNPGANLAYGTGYDLFVSAGALTDLSGNAATGYSAQGGYNFTTTAGFTTVAGSNVVDHSLKVAIADNLSISFGESVAAGTTTAGTQFIKLWSNTGALVETFDVATHAGNHGGSVAFSGNSVVLDPGANLVLTSGYYLTVDSQAIKAANAASTTYYAGVSNSTTLAFSTEAAVQIDPGQLNNTVPEQWAGQQIEGVGDVDGDGISDFVVGSYQTVYDPLAPGSYAYGKYYLVFGQAGTWSPVQNVQQLKDAGRAIEIYGTASNPLTRVVQFGDMNHDGFNDLLFTSSGRSPDTDTSGNDNSQASNDGDVDAGAAFVLYGKARANWAPSINITQIGSDGLEITGGLPQEQFGFSAATGDFNKDGTVDILFGMPVNHRDGYASGEAFVLNGGDFTESLMSVGTTGANTILGDFNANRIAGQGGDDTIIGLGGADILRGGAGNDTIGLSDLNFVLMDGGTGVDTLKFIGHGINLDMTGYAGSSLRSFEKIDLTGDGNNSLTINYNEVSSLLERQLYQAYGTYVKLTINGNAGDAVTLDGPWAMVSSNATYTTYALDGLYVQVGTDITRTVAGWTVPYVGATMDLGALPSGFRTSTVTSGIGLDQSNGNYLVNIGDVNNDGFADFAVRQDAVTASTLLRYDRDEGAQWYNNNTQWIRDPHLYARSETRYSGEAYVIYGKAGGLGAVNLSTPVGADSIKLTGSASANENLGAYFSGLGDINGDGISDFIIGASQSSNTFTFNEGGEKSGSDPDGTNPAGATATYITAPNTGSPDWNSDSWTQSVEGRQYFFLGGDATLTNRTGGAITSTTLSNDYNASSMLPTTYDTTVEAITDLPDRGPANNVANTVYTYTTTATKADGSFVGTFNQQLGSNWAPVSLGDVNGDGFDDFVTGTSNTRLILGSASGWTGFDTLSTAVTWTQKLVTVNGNQNSNAIASAGDVNGDGYNDIIMSWDANGATLVFGQAGNTWNAATTLGASVAGSATVTKSTFISIEPGYAIVPTFTRSLGDINGDGYSDILFASNPANDYSAKDNGGAYVLFGSATGWDTNVSLAGLAAAGRGFRITGGVDFDYAGYDVTNAGDVNGDGYNDFVVAAYGDDESANGVGGANTGSAYLIFGRATGWKDISLLAVQDYGIQILGGAADASSLWQSLGDIDGDGLDDLSYSKANALTTTILYGNENFTSGSNVGVQHITDLNDSLPGNSTIDGGMLSATRGALLADTLIGNAGNDILIGDGGRDVLIGGAGNDLLKVADGGFFRLDGGTGVDTVEVTAGASIDFTAMPNNRVANIEILQLGAGDQNIVLNHLNVLNMTSNSNMAIDTSTAVGNASFQKGHALVIESSAGHDDVTLNGGWTATAVATHVAVAGSSSTFSVYQHGADNIYAVIDDAVTKHIS
ncbi:MAG: hypothetical protein JWR21_2508, partial [Herminiimonas sp.]|nr:hypothetical protein [Herminiimonas sp.]